MRYNLNNLDTESFEKLVQSLVRKIIGNGTITFGDGTDGGREATFTGNAPYPSTLESWSGYWVFQAKFKTVQFADEEKDFAWVESQLRKELEKYSTRVIKVQHPENYLLFTNVILTAKAVTGGRDKANKLELSLAKEFGINNIRIVSFDDIQGFLDTNRDIAISYAPFILPGDILYKLLELLNFRKERNERVKEIVSRFLHFEFLEDSQSKLDQTGKLTNDKINLEKVFIDLEVSHAESQSSDKKFKFIQYLIKLNNNIANEFKNEESRFVLIAGPGYGKSTLTQFLCQIYRAYFLLNFDDIAIKIKEVNLFIEDFKSLIRIEPKWIRFPFRIILKEYAGWIINRTKEINNEDISILEYIRTNINKKSNSGDLTSKEVEDIIKNLPWLFIFDGLDEVPATSNRNDVLSEISSFVEILLKRIKSNSIIISTTRPQGYSKEFDNNLYKHYYISDLSKLNCELYLKRLVDNLIDDSSERQLKLSILRSALNDNEISRLMKSPLQASIMAILVKSGGEPPRNKFDLFTDYYDIIFKREKQRNIAKILSDKPDYVKNIHNKLGFYLQSVSEKSSNPSASIKIEKFRKLIIVYLEELGLKQNEIDIISNDILSAATNRLVFISEIEDQKVGFAIRSLQEYFAASGYIHNVKDADISKKITAICQNSYWNNTFLFCIGYLSKNKTYLIEFIESLCYELNGSADALDSESLSSITKSGSWLALDILNEGIFRGYPKIETKFCKLIKPLFEIGINDKHENISKLPDDIVENIVTKFINESLKISNINYTSWILYMQLLKKNYKDFDPIKSFWPENNNSQIFLLNLFVEYNFYNDVVLNKFLFSLENNSKMTFRSIILNSDNKKFTSSLFNNVNTSNKAKSIIIEIISLQLFTYYFSSTSRELLEIIGINSPSVKYHTATSDDILSDAIYDSVKVDILPGFNFRLVKTKIKEEQSINKLFLIAEELNILILKNLIQFLKNPDYNTFLDFYNIVEKEDEEYKLYLKAFLKTINSFFNYFFNNDVAVLQKPIDELISFIDNLNFAEIPNAENFAIENLKYSTGKYINVGNIGNSIAVFKEKYLKNESTTVDFVEFGNIIATYIEHSADADLTLLKSDAELVSFFKKSVINITEKNLRFNKSLLIATFFLMDVENANKLIINANKLILNYHKTDSVYGLFLGKDLIKSIFLKANNVLQYNVLIKAFPIYKAFLQILILWIEISKNVEGEIISFSNLIDYKTVVDDEKYKALILLADKKFDSLHLNEIKRILSKYYSEEVTEEFFRHFYYYPHLYFCKYLY